MFEINKTSKIKVEQFAETVRRYCAWAEHPLADAESEMQTARLLLAELHNVIFLDELETDDEIKLEDISREKWQAAVERFAKLPVKGYWLVFDPIKAKENETVYTELSDDLADIYQDIKYGLKLFDAGHIAEAVWQWKFKYKIHWGWHLLEAQKVIHFWFFNNEEL